MRLTENLSQFFNTFFAFFFYHTVFASEFFKFRLKFAFFFLSYSFRLYQPNKMMAKQCEKKKKTGNVIAEKKIRESKARKKN